MKRYLFIEKILLRFSKISNRILNYVLRNRLGRIILELRKKNIEIKYVYDIGANKGEWSSFYKKTSLNKSIFYLFEANEAHKNDLVKTNFNFFIEVLSKEKKKIKFYNNNSSTGDSCYMENTGNHKNIIPQEITAITLNQLVKQNNLPLPDLIKIDTQGSEIDILKGSSEILKNCKILFLECPILAKFNQNNLNILDYLKFLESIGFIPHDVNQIMHYHGYLTHFDMIFINKEIFKELGLNQELLKSFY